MRNTIKALLFDFTKENLDTYNTDKINMTSGNDVLNDIIQFENGNFIDSPFVQLIDIEYESDEYYIIRNEEMCKVLEIDKNNFFYYGIYARRLKKTGIYTSRLRINSFEIIANKEMFEGTVAPIFEIRANHEMTSWQAIAGKFIVIRESIPSGIAEVYNPITKYAIEMFKQDFQIRYSGSKILDIGVHNPLPRINKDPFNSNIIKIIDPSTFQISFDSQIIQENSSEKSSEIWKRFEERYR